MSSIPYVYRYACSSDAKAHLGGASLEAATCDARLQHPYLFEGRVLYPAAFARNLSLLAKIVRTHFFLTLDPNYLDPVVSVAPDFLRFEGFSACCGVYARADLPIASFEGKAISVGTTNVDFGTQMQLALALRANDSIQFRVGREHLELETAEEKVIERKVMLPARWVKSFTEVQTLQPLLRDKAKVTRDQASKFIRSLPKGKSPKATHYAIPSGTGLRLSTRPAAGSVAFCGVHRVRVLEALIPTCDFLRVWGDEESGVSGWEVSGPAGRMFVLLSPQPYRGFSGEGQNLTTLATEPWQFSQAGFDVVTQTRFDRELPLDLTNLKKMQPRLINALNLLRSGNLSVAKTIDESQFDMLIPGKDVKHYVRLRTDGDVCSCRWYSQYQGQRGPCKHVLAARMFVEQQPG